MVYQIKCQDCGKTTEIDERMLEEGTIVSCPLCGCEYIYSNGEFVQAEYEGESWGE